MKTSITSKSTRWIVAAQLAALLSLGGVTVGCAKGDPGEVCEPGATQTCVCATLQPGAQSCNGTGHGWDPCVCAAGPGPIATPGKPGPRPRPVAPSPPVRRPGAEVVDERTDCVDHRQPAGGADPDLVARYTFDGHLCDASENRLDGKRTAAVRFVADRLGRPGRAVELTHRADARVDLGEAKAISRLGDRFTIAFWVKVSPGNGGIIINHDVLGTRTDDWIIGVHREGKHAGGPYLTFGNPAATATARIDDGTWHHVAVRRERASGRLDFFADGERHDHVLDPRLEKRGLSGTLTAQCPTNLGPYRMPGRWADNGFTGSVDDLQFYRRLLSDQEVRRLAGQG